MRGRGASSAGAHHELVPYRLPLTDQTAATKVRVSPPEPSAERPVLLVGSSLTITDVRLDDVCVDATPVAILGAVSTIGRGHHTLLSAARSPILRRHAQASQEPPRSPCRCSRATLRAVTNTSRCRCCLQAGTHRFPNSSSDSAPFRICADLGGCIYRDWICGLAGGDWTGSPSISSTWTPTGTPRCGSGRASRFMTRVVV